MVAHYSRRSSFGLNTFLFSTFLVVLWLAGGASRSDVLGQVIVRGCSWALLMVAIIFGERPSTRAEKPVLLILLAALAIPFIQLVPLPPSIWRTLPGREVFVQASVAVGEAQPWRPWAIVPDAAVNAASSLIVPFTTFILVAGMTLKERSRLPGAMLAFVVASTLVGLLQLSGVKLGNPFVNGIAGHVSGTFANRNHFALLIAVGCLLAPAWAFGGGGGRPRGRAAVALGLLPLFFLTLLASGSRSGVIVGILALAMTAWLVRQEFRRDLERLPRWVLPATVLAILGVIALLVLVGVAAGRSESIERAFALDVGEDMRGRALPTVLAMTGEYFPFGSGLGGFDTVFRLHEPFDLLKPTYFNHAHNDFLEIALDAGLPGLFLLAAALSWWAWASMRAWCGFGGARRLEAKVGSAVLLLVIVASALDYPARTPAVMAMCVMAGIWLCARADERGTSALPNSDRSL